MKLLLGFISVLASACGSRATPATPIAMTIKPVNVADPPSISPPATSDAGETRHELVVGGGRLCIRSDGEVHCLLVSELLDHALIQDASRLRDFDDVTSLAAGAGFLCGARRDGSVVCRGENAYGQLGAKRGEERLDSAVRVLDVARAKRIALGPTHACAILEDRSVACWGRNDYGQTGSDTSYAPEAHELAGATIVPGVQAIGLAATYNSTCALRPTHDVICWGAKQDQRSAWGGSGPRTERPTLLPDVTALDEIAASESEFCGLRGGSVVCWSSPTFLDNDAREAQPNGPWTVPGIRNAKHLAFTSDHGCAILANGKVACFGYGYSGALGYPSEGYDPLPGKVVEGVDRAVAIAITGGLTCALTAETELYCWGRWYTGKTTHDQVTPARVQLR